MDSTISVAIISGTAIVLATIFKFVPRRHLNGKGERLATKEQFDALEKYTHAFVHSLRNEFLQPQSLKVALIEQAVKNLEHDFQNKIDLGEKIDAMRSEHKTLGERQCALLEAALKRTYGQNNP